MAVQKLQVFLASRFDEFAELRAFLRNRINATQIPPVEAIDLNDNLPDPNPPITRCYEGVDRAELIILLVGETYGSEVSDGQSYTHLEYRRAEELRKPVLAFLVSTAYSKSASYRPTDAKMQGWIDELYRRKCASRLDPQRGWNDLAIEIYGQVLERLWDIFNKSSYDGFDDDIEMRLVRENSPITIDDLGTLMTRADRASHPLRALAADHAAEARTALSMNFTDVALHHLTQAHELIRLEIVPAYWLALLLIAARKERDGARLASFCAELAGRRSDAPKFAVMASLILAARASERLENRDDARNHAAAAHEATPYHWLAKVELGRQFALDNHADEAIGYAEEAFWLRPLTIMQLQHDSAWRRLGSRFDRFLDRLRDTVRSETKSIQHLEASVQDFARTLEVADEEAPAIIPQGASLLHLVDIARQSARHTLESLQRCATNLAANAASFAAIGFTGLTPHTREQIQAAIDSEKARIAELTSELTRRQQAAADARRRTFNLAAIGAGVALVFALLAVIGGAEEEWGGLAVAIVALVVVVVVFSTSAKTSWDKHLAATGDVRELEDRLRQSRHTLADAHAARDSFDRCVLSLRERVERFCALVSLFEKRATSRLPFAPAVSKERSIVNDIVRIGDVRAEEPGLARDRDLLPAELSHLGVGVAPPTPHHWLARRIVYGGEEMFSRKAAYFTA